MAQIKTLKISSDGVPVEHDAVNDDLSIKSLAVSAGIDMGSTNITNLADPTLAQHAVTLSYLETELNGNYVHVNEVGAANGIAPLNASSKIDATYLPSYVDDVLEYANLAGFPGTGEQGKIYVAIDTNKTYRWSGSVYIEISSSDVNSVNGQTGVVVLNSGHIAEGANLYFTDGRAQSVAWDESLVAGEALSANDALYVSASGAVSKADASVLAKTGVIGFAKAAALNAASVGVRCRGKMGGFTGLTAGARQFLSTSGAITPTVPAGSGNTIVQVGYAITATELLVNIEQLGRRA